MSAKGADLQRGEERQAADEADDEQGTAITVSSCAGSGVVLEPIPASAQNETAASDAKKDC